MRFLTLLITLQLIFINSFAQDSNLDHKTDSVLTKKTIAVVPFMPQMYYNDLSRLWYKTGDAICQEKQIKEISNTIVKNLSDSLSRNYDLIDLNQSQTISTTDFLLEYYLLSHFAFADTFPQKASKLKWMKNKLTKKNTNKTEVYDGQLRSEKQDHSHQFLNVKLQNIKKFKTLCRDLGVDEVLFINQFDVKGDFSSPYNSGRETDYFINIHYSLYDKNGNLLLGNKTKFATTNEKARYGYFIDHDLRIATGEIIKKIKELNLSLLELQNSKKKQ